MVGLEHLKKLQRNGHTIHKCTNAKRRGYERNVVYLVGGGDLAHHMVGDLGLNAKPLVATSLYDATTA
jgi:hypothetical protein